MITTPDVDYRDGRKHFSHDIRIILIVTKIYEKHHHANEVRSFRYMVPNKQMNEYIIETGLVYWYYYDFSDDWWCLFCNASEIGSSYLFF